MFSRHSYPRPVAFGGCDDIETFLEPITGSYPPAVQRRELSNVDWLDVGGRGVGEQEPELEILEERADG
jgi:hypothetical protein